MATRNVRRKGASRAAEKKGKGKWIIIILLLIIAGVLAWYFLFNSAEKKFFFDLKPGFDAFDKISVEKAQSPDAESLDKGSLPPSEFDEDSLSDQPVKKTKPRIIKKQYFIKIGSCLSTLCQREYRRQLKRVKLTMFTRKRTHKTTYYELISEASYPYARARKKIAIINKYNDKIGFPYIVKHKDRYKISFGLFPKKQNAQVMKSHLAHLYPQVNMRFLMEPTVNKFTEVNIYTGPFSKSLAEKVLANIQDIPDFEFASITRKL